MKAEKNEYVMSGQIWIEPDGMASEEFQTERVPAL
jgi:hypothetical protein